MKNPIPAHEEPRLPSTGGPEPPPADLLNAIGVLKRREIEARLAGPLIEALAEAFGRQEVLAVVRDVIEEIAREQGQQLALSMGGSSLAHFAESLEAWQKDEAMQMDVLEQDERAFSFNVTRCRYAELYHLLGMPELGGLLSCSRDFALIQGFNPEVSLERTQTIMEGAPFCDFRFRLASTGQAGH